MECMNVCTLYVHSSIGKKKRHLFSSKLVHGLVVLKLYRRTGRIVKSIILTCQEGLPDLSYSSTDEIVR